MRLRTLLIEKYGNFDRTELSFDPAPGCLNLVLAPNGAGKSVLRRAFHDLLFGIPLQSDMKFRFDYPGMHLLADAVSIDGAQYSFGWQRRTGRIFPDAAADPAASRWLAELLAAVTPRQVEMLWALDTERLRSGGRDLAAGDSTLGSALLSGTGELAPVRALRRSLDERRAGIWTRGKSSLPLNKALSRLAAAAKQRRDSVQTPRSLGALQAELEATRARRQQAGADAAAAQAELGRLNRIELTRAPLTALAEAAAWLAAHGDAPVLPDGLGEALSQARHAASLAATRLDAARAQLAEADARTGTIARDEAADAVAVELDRLPGALGDAATKRRDSLARAAERAAALAQVAAALREIGSAVAPEQAGTLLRTLPEMEAAREKISQHTVVTTTLDLARTRLVEARAAAALLEADAVAAPVVPPEGLDLLVGEIRRTRDPLAHAAELAEATRVAGAAELACLARLPGWTGTVAELVALTPATDATYARLAEMAAGAGTKLVQAVAEQDRLQAQRSQWELSLATLRQQALPDAAALATARAKRDGGWQLVYARAFAGAPDEAGERAYGAGDALPIAFERHMRAADAVADAWIKELARVEQASRLVADLGASEPAWAAAQAAVARAAERQAVAVARWAEACQRLRLPPDSALRDVSALLTAREAAIDARQQAELARGARASLAAAHAAWASRLARLLGEDPGDLAVLLPMAEARLQAGNRAATEQVARETRRAQANGEVHAASAALTAAEGALARWKAGWQDTLRSLARPEGETPAVTEKVLAALGALDRHHHAAAGLQARIDGMQADIGAFAAVVAGLAARLGMPPGSDPFTTAEVLIARRDRAKSLRDIATEAGIGRDAAIKRTQEAAQQHGDAVAVLRATVASCGAADAEAAERQIAAARERTRQERLRDGAEARLREVGGSASLDSLAAAAASLPQEAFEAARQAADAALTQARQHEQEAAVRLAELERQFAADAAATGASEAAEAEAATAAEAGRLLDEYLLLRLAAGMLGHALDRVEEHAGPTAVQRIAAAFEAITHGAWSIRASENAKGELVLLALECGMNEPAKQIDQLSEGTRDQLYLALRLVAIERHVASAPPLPFIADDILQTFDDARAHAAMQALVGLSHHVQVVVLTHHPHLLDVAAGLPIHVQRLGGYSPGAGRENDVLPSAAAVG